MKLTKSSSIKSPSLLTKLPAGLASCVVVSKILMGVGAGDSALRIGYKSTGAGRQLIYKNFGEKYASIVSAI